MIHDDFERAVFAEVGRRFKHVRSWRTTKKNIHLDVLKRTSEILGLSFSHCIENCCERNDCIILPNEALETFDDLWNDILVRCNSKISAKDVAIREKVDALHIRYTDLVRFIELIAKRDTIVVIIKDQRTLLLRDKRVVSILAVDGFCGLSPTRLVNYIWHLDDRKRWTRGHVQAVRAIYKEMNNQTDITGTGASCLVLMALITVYKRILGSKIDDEKRLAILRTHKYILNFLRKNGEGEMKLLSNGFVERKLIPAYLDRMNSKNLKTIATSKIAELVNIANSDFN